MTDRLSVVLIGAGNMGGALFQSWVEKGVLDPGNSAVIDPAPSDKVLDLCENAGIHVNPEGDRDGYGICVLGVKPQMFGDILPGLDWPSFDRTVFVSIAAGLNIAEIGNLLSRGDARPRVVRAMPNLPAAVGAGTTLLTAGADVAEAERADVTRLFDAAGASVWTDSEDELDRLMGVSGCGPAYVYHFVEALDAAAQAHGASPEDARALAEQTVIGAALQLQADGRDAASLRKAVTSPGGTTAAGLSALMEEDALRKLMREAVDRAYARAQEMAG